MTQTEDGWTEGSTLFPLLWNQCDANYFKKNVKQDAWIEIGNAMKKLQILVKIKFLKQNMRQRYIQFFIMFHSSFVLPANLI